MEIQASKNTTKKRKKILLFGIGKEKEYVIDNLSVLLASGLPVELAIDSIQKEIKSSVLKKILSQIHEDIEGGSSLWKALEDSGIFPDQVISLVKIGEETGRLSENLSVVSEQQEKERDFKSKVSSAAMYPLFVFGLTFLVGTGIAWFILPRLASVFSSLRIKLPLITQILIGFGSFLGKYGYIVIPITGVLLVLVFLLFFKVKKTRFLGQSLLFSIPPIKRLLQEVELSRFGYILGTLLKAGLPVVPSLESLANAEDFYMYKKFYMYLKDSIDEGKSFQKSFSDYKSLNKIVPPSVQQLIISGEQSGHLPESLLKIGHMYESKTDITTKNLTVLLEPILLVIVWLGVVAVALAVILPLYSLLGGLNSNPEGNSTPPTPAAVEKVIPSISVTPTVVVDQIQIQETSVGYLNVRSAPSATSSLISQVKPGEKYHFKNKQDNWYQISLSNNQTGWVSGEFVSEVK